MDDSDWRLQGQGQYLIGVMLPVDPFRNDIAT